MNREQVTENSEEIEKKTCLDCRYCKVSLLSTKTKRMCYCFKKKHRVEQKESSWLKKTVCKKFMDMA